MLIHWIWLSTRSGMSDRGRMALLEHFSDAEDVYFASADSLGQVESLSKGGMAMKGALTAGAPVVGVLGCGADIVYPSSNHSLFADTERNGCILTEFPPETPPFDTPQS